MKKQIELYIALGEDIVEFYKMAVEKAKKTGETYFFNGNGIRFVADGSSDPNLAEKHLNECYEYEIKELGPGELVIDPEYRKKKDIENQERRKKLAEECEKRQVRNEMMFSQVKEMVKDVKLDFIDNPDYIKLKEKNSKDGYSLLCFEYAEYLAKLLELVSQERPFSREDVNDCEDLIGYLSITGFQHGCVLNILRDYWDKYDSKIFY